MNPDPDLAHVYIRSIRSGEHSASVALGQRLSPDAVLVTNGPMPGAPTETIAGHAEVLRRASGNWAVTMALRHARWRSPEVIEGGRLCVAASFEHLGGIVPQALEIVITPDAAGRIARIEQRYTPRQAATTDTIPPGARALIDNARINETPLMVAHTDESGLPMLTFRGSVQVWNDTALCIWIRQATGGLVRSIAKNPAVSLAYRDGPRAMLLIQGRARMEDDPAIRARVFEMSPEVEQNHDPGRKGAAMIVEVEKMQGFSTGGEPVRMVRKA